MPATQRQRRYDQVMGDKEPNVADKKFVHDLQTRLEIKYYESQLIKEKQLAESEKKRIRKLVMEGVIENDDKRQSKSDEQREDEWKEFWPQNPNKTLEEYEEEKRRAEEKHHKEEAAAEEERRQDAEAEAVEGDEGQTGAAAGGGGDTDRADGTGGGGGTTQRSNQGGTAPLGKYVRVQSARVQALHEEEDLDQLYQKASDLVYIMAPVPKGKKGKANK